MTVAAHPASQTRSLSLPTARRTTRALTSPHPKIRLERRPDAKPPHAHDRTGSSPSFSSTRLPVIGLRGRRVRFAGDLQISIGRAPPNSALPPRGFLLGRLSNAGPRTRTTVPHRAGVRNPSPELPFLVGPVNGRQWPRAEWQFTGDKKRKRMFDGRP